MKRSLANSLLLTVVITLLAACSGDRKASVLPASKLEAVLYDYHMAQVIVNDLPSNQRYKKDLYFSYVYDKHGVTEAQIDSSLVYYARYPEGLSEIYANLSKRIEADIKRLESEDKPIRAREAVAVVGDSVDLWYDARIVQLTSSPMDNSRYTFTIPTDTNFKAGDRLAWSGKALFLQVGADTLHRYLHLDLKVRYMNDSIASADTTLYASGEFAITVTDTAVVKSITGTAYLKSRNASERLLMVEPSLTRLRGRNVSLVVDSALILQQVALMNESQAQPSGKFEMKVSHE